MLKDYRVYIRSVFWKDWGVPVFQGVHQYNEIKAPYSYPDCPTIQIIMKRVQGLQRLIYWMT